MRAIHTCVVFCLLASVAVAQVGGTNNARDKVRKKVDAMRKAMREGKILKFNVYVKVKFKNGNRLKGVVKNGKFVELQDGIDFVSAAELNDRRAGMRVWYTAGTNSFVFLRYEDIEKYSIGSKLSEKQIKSIELKLAKELTESQENYRRMREQQRKSLAERLAGGTGVAKDDPDAPKPLGKEELQLLQDFPPAEGWGKDKIEKLKTRRITLGTFPTEKERRFEKSFAQWETANKAHQKILDYEASKAKQTAKKQATGGKAKPATPPGSGTAGKPPK